MVEARYMCLDIGNFYLMAALKYFEYMQIPLALFPIWIIEQYDLKMHVLNRFVHLKMRRAVWVPATGRNTQEQAT
jgi:hypothetical protein